METERFWHLGGVSDNQLRSALAALLASGYRTEARIVAHIAEVEERKLHVKDGCASLFEYCVKQLGLSESEAFHRLTAARIARRFPTVFSLIEGRAIHLTGVCLLRDYLTPENHLELLAEASHKTKLQVQELLARRFPRPDVASYVRKLPDLPRAKQWSVQRAERAKQASPAVEQPSHRLQVPPAAPTRARVEPTSEARYRIQLNASSSLKEKLELFQSLVSHSIPSGDVAATLERALDLALEQAQKRRFATLVSTAADAHRARSFRSITSSRGRAVAAHQRGICGCSAPRTIACWPSATSVGSRLQSESLSDAVGRRRIHDRATAAGRQRCSRRPLLR